MKNRIWTQTNNILLSKILENSTKIKCIRKVSKEKVENSLQVSV